MLLGGPVQATWENIWEWCRNKKKSQNRQSLCDASKPAADGEGTEVEQPVQPQLLLASSGMAAAALMTGNVQQEHQQQQICAALLQAIQAWQTAAAATAGGVGAGAGAAAVPAGTVDEEAAARALPTALTALFAPTPDAAAKAAGKG